MRTAEVTPTKSYRRRAARIWLACLLATLPTTGCKRDSHMTFTRLEYLISEMMGPPETLRIERNGSARYESHTNIADEGASPIGIFQTRLSPATLDALYAALANPPFPDSSDHSGNIKAGERYRLIRLIDGPVTVEKAVGTRYPVAENLRGLISILDRIVTEARRHPVQALRLDIKSLERGPAGIYEGVIQLSNPGTASVVCPDPTSLSAAGGSRLSMRAWPNRDKSQIHSTDVLDLNISHILYESVAPDQSADGLLDLGPGRSATFRFQALPALVEKAYLAQLVYKNTDENKAGREVPVFELYSPPVSITRP